jgi:hypothetical protein
MAMKPSPAHLERQGVVLQRIREADLTECGGCERNLQALQPTPP